MDRQNAFGVHRLILWFYHAESLVTEGSADMCAADIHGVEEVARKTAAPPGTATGVRNSIFFIGGQFPRAEFKYISIDIIQTPGIGR